MMSNQTVEQNNNKVVKKVSKKQQEKSERQTFVGMAKQRLARLEGQEKRLTAIIEKRKANLQKLQVSLGNDEVRLDKVKRQLQSELTQIKELAQLFQNHVDA